MKAASASLISIVPSSTITSLGYPSPNDLVNIAAIGVGSRGGQVIGNIATPEVVVERPRMSGFLRQPYGVFSPKDDRSTGGIVAIKSPLNTPIFMPFVM